MKVINRPLDGIHPYDGNPRRNKDAVSPVADSIREFGFRQPIVIDSDGVIIVGHTRYFAAQLLGLAEVPVHVANMTPEQAKAYRLADNRTNENADWDMDLLAKELEELKNLDFNIDLTGFDQNEVTRITNELMTDEEEKERIPPIKPETSPGDLYILGEHRLICGDSTDEDTIKRLYDGQKPTLMLTDPPYCSGGFQESGRSGGSVGTNVDYKKIHNDTLSTRGYTNLMERVLRRTGALYAYMFTDWRMWVTLFDISESCGLGVRSMIVWDKSHPGMGRGWRAQHELIMFASCSDHHFDKHKCYGNVIASSRTGNKHHTTEKPVDLLEKVLENMRWCPDVVDPFCGSGSTLIAAERQRRRCFAVEIDPAYCDVIVKRWEEFTGKIAVRA